MKPTWYEVVLRSAVALRKKRKPNIKPITDLEFREAAKRLKEERDGLKTLDLAEEIIRVWEER